MRKSVGFLPQCEKKVLIVFDESISHQTRLYKFEKTNFFQKNRRNHTDSLQDRILVGKNSTFPL